MSRFLNLGAADILDLIFLCCGNVLCILDHSAASLDINSTLQLQQSKRFHAFPSFPWG